MQGVGDSIMLSATDELAPIHVNAEVSRQFAAGLAVMKTLKLPKKTVVHLGTNGPIKQTDMDELVALIGKRQLWLLTLYVPRDWEAPNNVLIHDTVKAYENVHLVRWRSLAAFHSSWFTDGIHPNAEGQAAYADLIKTAMQ